MEASQTYVEPVVKHKAPLLFLILFFLIQATVLTVFTVPFTWELFWVAVFSYFLRMFGPVLHHPQTDHFWNHWSLPSLFFSFHF